MDGLPAEILSPRAGAQPLVPPPLPGGSRKSLRRRGTPVFADLESLRNPAAFAQYLAPVREAEWVVYAKPPFGGPAQVLKYLARYTHRVAISNRRLLGLENGKVTFRWKDYAQGNKPSVMTLDAAEFIRRFLMHVMPRSFVRIRYYGFMANRHRAENLQQCRQLLCQEKIPETANLAETTRSAEPGDDMAACCPACQQGQMRIIGRLERQCSDASVQTCVVYRDTS